MKNIIIILFFAGIATVGLAQTTKPKVEPKWQDFSTTINAPEQEKITMVYIYKSPCDLCPAVEEAIFADTTVVNALTKDFMSIKFDAAIKDDVVVKGQKYPFADFGGGNGYNIYAVVLLGGKMNYSTFVFLDKEGEKIGTHYFIKDPKTMAQLDAAEFLFILRYYSSGAYAEEGASYDEWIKKQ